MRALRSYAFVAILMALVVTSCDSTKPTTTAIPPDVQSHWDDVKERIDSGRFFRRVEALDEFIKTDPPPMLLLEAQALRKKFAALAEIENTRIEAVSQLHGAIDAAASAEEAPMWASSDVKDLRNLVLRQLSSDYSMHGWGAGLEKPVVLRGRRGTFQEFPLTARLDLFRFRDTIRRTWDEFGTPVAEDCMAACLNDTIDRKLFSYIGGELFLGLGKLDGPRLDKLAEALWIAPDEKVMGVSGRDYYAAFKRVPQDLYRVRMAIADHGDDKSMKAYREVRDKMQGPADKRISRHYRIWSRQAGLNNTLETHVEYKIIDSYVGFWLRRMYDGTEPVVMKWLEKTLQTYDPEFLESFDEPAEPESP